MTNRIKKAGLQIDKELFNFIEQEILTQHPYLKSEQFWPSFAQLLKKLTPLNKQLLVKRENLQQEIDAWHQQNPGPITDKARYKAFLQEIAYLQEEPEDFHITTKNVDKAIKEQAGPQLVVPIMNARYVLNAANARWGSLYDALYGTDAISQEGDALITKEYNPKRGAKVIAFGRDFLDQSIPLVEGSHHDVITYYIKRAGLIAVLKDGSTTVLQTPSLFVGFNGRSEEPSSLLFLHHGLHFDILIDKNSAIGQQDPAGIKDIIMEAALSAIIDCEDSVAAVDGEDKTLCYRNWLGLMQGSLVEEVSKNGQTFTRRLNPDRAYITPNGEDSFKLAGRSLLFIRNVGHLMTSPAILDEAGHEIPEGILDAVMTGLIAPFDFERDENKNSHSGSVYIVKPKMHGPEEVAFANDLFAEVEDLTKLPRNTLKIGVMDEERRTSINLKACIKAVSERLVFINTGFLDRTGDEIHTAMQAGAMVRKAEMKSSKWLNAYELNNVQVGLSCGLVGKAQIGKGMWAMPDLMAAMLEQKIAHPQSGATTAWVPSPTAATLHALHYHQVNVFAVQKSLSAEPNIDILDDLLTPPIAADTNWSAEDIQQELDNNCQGLLGYVVRWVEQGVGCSKVPDIYHIGLMEDRATLRISSQHICNWLLHGIVTEQQVKETLIRMAKIVDEQNQADSHYQPMTGRFASSPAFLAAQDLIFKGLTQPSGYTEPLLHYWRKVAKTHTAI